MKTTTLFLLIISLIACREKPKETLPIARIKTDSVFRNLDASSVSLNDSFLAVYKLSSKTIAIVIPLHFGEDAPLTFFDSLFRNVNYSKTESLMPIGSVYYDTSGEYKLLTNKKLEVQIRERVSSFYTVYGTKGVTKISIKDIVFALDECKTNFIALTIPNFNTAIYGLPLLSSTNRITLNYGGHYEDIERKIETLYKSEEGDYGDSMKTKVFAHRDSYYFTYADDFLWGKAKGKQRCFFPARIIFNVDRTGNIKRYWAEDLDLFGIPCD